MNGTTKKRDCKITENISDVDSLFHRVGSRLGWFESDINETLKKLTIQSENKKRSKARINRPQSAPTDEYECKETKQNHQKNKFTNVLTEKKDLNIKILEKPKSKFEVLSDEKAKLTNDLCKKNLCENQLQVSKFNIFQTQSNNEIADLPHSYKTCVTVKNQVSSSDNELPDLTNSYEAGSHKRNKNQVLNICKFDNLQDDLSDGKLSNSCLKTTQGTSPNGKSRNKPLHRLEEAKRLSFSSDDNEDNFECFLQSSKPCSQASTSNKGSGSSSSSDCFIKDLDSDSDEEDEAFYLNLRDRISSSVTPWESQSFGTSNRVFSSSVTPLIVRHSNGVLNSLGSDNVFLSPNLKKKTQRKIISTSVDIVNTNSPEFIIVTPASKKKLKERPLSDVKIVETSRKISGGISFLTSLSSHVSLENCHTEAIPFRKDFKKTKINLVSHLFKLYNQKIFDNQLPFDLDITWNARLTKTAGYCRYSINPSRNPPRRCKIELSDKVCDSCDRVRDTLIHELCHAAAWLISGYKDGHGSFWKAWASKVNTTFFDIPLVSRCHNYQINAKYVYRCLHCKLEVKRHSKSLDTNRKVCGRCRGSFELLVNGHGTKSRPASKFALYVKENYKQVKNSSNGINHQKIMQALSAEFSKKTSLN